MRKVKEGVNYVFEQNPKLSEVGTKEQYSKYLDTIFPISKVKQILYHSSRGPNVKKFTTISNWTPKGSSKFRIKQEISKGLFASKDRDFLTEFQKHNLSRKIYPLLFNVKSPKVIKRIVNSNDVEIKKIEKLQKDYDSIISNEGGRKNTIIIFEPEQIHILGSKKDMKGFRNYVQREKTSINKSNSLEAKLIQGFFILSFLTGLILNSHILTGKIVADIENNHLSSPGIFLLIFGLFGFLIFKLSQKS